MNWIVFLLALVVLPLGTLLFYGWVVLTVKLSDTVGEPIAMLIFLLPLILGGAVLLGMAV